MTPSVLLSEGPASPPALPDPEGHPSEMAFIPHVGWLAHEPGEELISLLRRGCFEAAEQAFFRLFLRPGDRVLDGGAHIGLYALAAHAATGGDCRVTCVEANPRTARLLRSNLQFNGFEDASVIEAAIWKASGSVRFIGEEPGRAAYARVAFDTQLEPGPAPVTTVEAVTLDDLVAKGGPSPVALVKLDLEGAEPEALEGASRVIRTGQCPLVVLEFTEANLERRGWTSQRLARLVAGLGLALHDFDAERCRLVPCDVTGPIYFRNLYAVRDPGTVNARLATASPRAVLVARDLLGRARACELFRELEEVPRLRALAESNETWALRTEALLAEEKVLSAQLRAWAEQAESRKAAEVAAARQEARDNESWALRTEALLAEERLRGASDGSPALPGFSEPTLDICLCSHNPRPEILALTIASLARQTVPPGTFQLLLVDNASSPPIPEEVLAPLLAAGHAARLTREATPGLTAARLHGIRRTAAPWMLFVDDDNELADDFVAQGLSFARSRDDLGCFGGRLLLPETVKPPKWAEPFLPYLGIKDAGPQILTGTGDRWGDWEPPGAGLWIRRPQLEAYLAHAEEDERSLQLGRKGSSGLSSCDDSLMARQSRSLGLLNAYNPALSLRHHIDPRRFRARYLVRLMAGYGRGHVLLESLLQSRQGLRLATPDYYGRPGSFLRVLAAEVEKSSRRSLRFAVGVAVYHWTARRHYLQEELSAGTA